MADPFDVMVLQFREAAALAAEYELRVRLLADKTPALRPKSLENVGVIEKDVFKHFEAHLLEGESDRLATTRRLRNKLFHAEFSTAREHLAELGNGRPAAAFKVARLPMDGSLTVESFMAALQAAKPFAIETAPSNGHLFAWFLQLSTDGSLGRAADVFRSANDIMRRLSAVEEE